MLKFLLDIPNAVTAIGLCFTVTALYLIDQREYDAAICLLIWAVMLDHVDGWLARHAKDRPREYAMVGGDMDSATDMVSAAIAPASIAFSLSGTSVISLIAGLLISLAACLRVGYFNNFGLTDAGRFHGVPLTYTVPLVGLIFMSGKFTTNIHPAEVLPWALMAMAVLHICPFGPPPVRGIGFLYFFLYAATLTLCLLLL